jgi:hypothetical protein
VDTGELRREDIELSEVTDNEARIIVKDVPHFGRNKKPISASLLAQILQEGHGLRTKDSQVEADITTGLSVPSISKGSPTAGWITKGQEAFNQIYQRYLNGR